MEFKLVGSGYLIKGEGKVLTRANPAWGGAMGTIQHESGLVEWRYFRTLEEALHDPDFGSMAQQGEQMYQGA